MNLLFRCLLLIMIAATTASCARGNREKERKPLIFTQPAIPVLLTSDSEVVKFRTLHYWDLFPFEDSLCIQQEDFAAQAFTDFVDLLQQTPRSVGEQALKGSCLSFSPCLNIFSTTPIHRTGTMIFSGLSWKTWWPAPFRTLWRNKGRFTFCK